MRGSGQTWFALFFNFGRRIKSPGQKGNFFQGYTGSKLLSAMVPPQLKTGVFFERERERERGQQQRRKSDREGKWREERETPNTANRMIDSVFCGTKKNLLFSRSLSTCRKEGTKSTMRQVRICDQLKTDSQKKRKRRKVFIPEYRAQKAQNGVCKNLKLLSELSATTKT